MPNEVLVALLALAGTLVGSFSGILVANKLVNFRLEQLEKKVDKHNCLVERTYGLEGDVEALTQLCEEKFKVVNHRIKDLEDEKTAK